MGVGAFLLLLRGVGGLDDEDALDDKEEGGGVEELLVRVLAMLSGLVPPPRTTYWMGREQDQVMAEYAAPDNRCKL